MIAVRSGGRCLAELALRSQTAGDDGDFAQAVLTKGQYEVIRS